MRELNPYEASQSELAPPKMAPAESIVDSNPERYPALINYGLIAQCIFILIALLSPLLTNSSDVTLQFYVLFYLGLLGAYLILSITLVVIAIRNRIAWLILCELALLGIPLFFLMM